MDFLSAAALAALLQVIAIDLVLAGDNAVVIGMAASGLEKDQRRKAIFIGLVAATVLRILFATVTVHLLDIVGLTLAGGLLLLWVCWKMFRELCSASAANQADHGGTGYSGPRKTLTQAVAQIVVADVTMSLDNVLAVAGVAAHHPMVLVAGLAVSIAFMGLAAEAIARLLERFRWIGYVGLSVIVVVAIRMIFEGGLQVWPYVSR
ncbi:TerC family protein [Rhizobium leucaenae]|uniref:YjbE family integral membrane protein n=1 Tax=Rhizobium leucaenae TaxID=29450 RepID=A0A7W6ZZJ4_9HYPH|nr:TerC family protein [Rhizobium leucaenae]MBB4571614.1 YjbE family integral membrane protein [Rhizobium leucaenae]MBB6304788.1 YjbE family integral membrane protein [Rhizobium leucaenae]